jgi:8-oxo-dGTP pyrophosphatase MutT (NUDIX family)
VAGVQDETRPHLARRGARAILVDECDRLVLVKRCKPDQPPYWTTPGGGIEDMDASDEAAMRRELAEELGAEAGPALPVFFASDTAGDEVRTQRFFLARLRAIDESKRSGPEVHDPARGSYLVERIGFASAELAGLDLRPPALHEFLLANGVGLLAELERLNP